MGEFVLALPLTGLPVLGLRQRSCTTSSKGRTRPWPSCGTCYTETTWDSCRYVLGSLTFILQGSWVLNPSREPNL